MKTSPFLAGMFKTDHPRAVDRYSDYFGESEPRCHLGERSRPRQVKPPGARRRRAHPLARGLIGVSTPTPSSIGWPGRFLEPTQDVLAVAVQVAAALFGVMVRTLAHLFAELFAPVLDFRVVNGEVLFMLVMVEVVRLLIISWRSTGWPSISWWSWASWRRCARSCCGGVTELEWKQVAVLTAPSSWG